MKEPVAQDSLPSGELSHSETNNTLAPMPLLAGLNKADLDNSGLDSTTWASLQEYLTDEESLEYLPCWPSPSPRERDVDDEEEEEEEEEGACWPLIPVGDSAHELSAEGYELSYEETVYHLHDQLAFADDLIWEKDREVEGLERELVEFKAKMQQREDEFLAEKNSLDGWYNQLYQETLPLEDEVERLREALDKASNAEQDLTKSLKVALATQQHLNQQVTEERRRREEAEKAVAALEKELEAKDRIQVPVLVEEVVKLNMVIKDSEQVHDPLRPWGDVARRTPMKDFTTHPLESGLRCDQLQREGQQGRDGVDPGPIVMTGDEPMVCADEDHVEMKVPALQLVGMSTIGRLPPPEVESFARHEAQGVKVEQCMAHGQGQPKETEVKVRGQGRSAAPEDMASTGLGHLASLAKQAILEKGCVEEDTCSMHALQPAVVAAAESSGENGYDVLMAQELTPPEMQIIVEAQRVNQEVPQRQILPELQVVVHAQPLDHGLPTEALTSGRVSLWATGLATASKLFGFIIYRRQEQVLPRWRQDLRCHLG